MVTFKESKNVIAKLIEEKDSTLRVFFSKKNIEYFSCVGEHLAQMGGTDTSEIPVMNDFNKTLDIMGDSLMTIVSMRELNEDLFQVKLARAYLVFARCLKFFSTDDLQLIIQKRVS